MSNLLSVPGKATSTGLILPANLSFEDWVEIGTQLRSAKEMVKFMLGDWLNFGENAYGEKYAQALLATDYDYDSLRNISYVCRKVPLSLRRDELSFSHHQAVAPLAEDLQRITLDCAVKDKETVKEIREHVKGIKASDGPTKTTYSVIMNINSRYVGLAYAANRTEAVDLILKEALKNIDEDEISFTVDKQG